MSELWIVRSIWPEGYMDRSANQSLTDHATYNEAFDACRNLELHGLGLPDDINSYPISTKIERPQ